MLICKSREPGHGLEALSELAQRNHRDKFSTLSMVQLCLDQLLKKSVPFIMTYMDELMFETEFHTTPALTAMQNNIRSHMTTFDGDNFVNWSRQQGHAISDLCHPLVDAHQACYHYISKIIPPQN